MTRRSCICRPGDPEGWYREDCPVHGREVEEARQLERTAYILHTPEDEESPRPSGRGL